MEIIVRASGERTESECIRRAQMQGNVHVIRAVPFGEAIRQTYRLALTFNQKWIPVIDADVLLIDGTLQKAIDELNDKPDIFCLDGKTKDKIMMKKRRAGIHIYNRELLESALQFVFDSPIKPESKVRHKMSKIGYRTYRSKIVFGYHDYEQYYRDLWRKSVCQTQKLARQMKKRPAKWKKLARTDKDFLVIYHAHKHGKKIKDKIVIDSRIDYGAKKGLRKLGLQEKGEYAP